jgi:hypothetical protein
MAFSYVVVLVVLAVRVLVLVLVDIMTIAFFPFFSIFLLVTAASSFHNNSLSTSFSASFFLRLFPRLRCKAMTLRVMSHR